MAQQQVLTLYLGGGGRFPPGNAPDECGCQRQHLEQGVGMVGMLGKYTADDVRQKSRGGNNAESFFRHYAIMHYYAGLWLKCRIEDCKPATGPQKMVLEFIQG